METNHYTSDVLIVGGGIAGATLALMLGRDGHNVIIIERQKSFPQIYKGEFLQPVSISILDNLQLLPNITKHCVQVTKMSYGIGTEKCITATYTDLDIPVRYGLNGDHYKIHAEVLQAATALPNVRFIPGVAARRVLSDQEKVVGLEAARGEDMLIFQCKVLVGADGIKSLIREQIGVKYDLFPYENKKAKICAFTLHLPEPATDEVTFLFGKGIGCGIFPLPERRIRMYLALRYDKWASVQAQGVEAVRELAASFYPCYRQEIEQIVAMKQVQIIPSYHLHTEKWAVNGAVLVGDACHAVSPALGQGMNLAIQGAHALSRTLNHALKSKDVTEQTLRTYEIQRRKYVRLIQNTSNMHTFAWLIRNPVIQNVRNALFKRIGKSVSIRQTQLHIVSGYQDRYPPVSQLFQLVGLSRVR